MSEFKAEWREHPERGKGWYLVNKEGGFAPPLEVEKVLAGYVKQVQELSDLLAKRYEEYGQSESARQAAEGRAALAADVGPLLDCIVWMSGSGDFGPDTAAGKFWAQYRDAIVKPTMQRYAEVLGRTPGPLLAALSSPYPPPVTARLRRSRDERC